MRKDINQVIELLNKLKYDQNFNNVYLSSKCINDMIDSLETSIRLINLNNVLD